jgi:hypothetical protein
MEIMGDMNQLTGEQRLALRSVIAAFNSYDTEHAQKLPSTEEPKHKLTGAELAAVYPSEPSLDIYTSTRDDFLQAAPRSRRHSL